MIRSSVARPAVVPSASRAAPIAQRLPSSTVRAQPVTASSFERAPVASSALAARASPRIPARSSYPNGAGIDRILAISNPVERNYAITQGYHDLSQAFAKLVGDDNANWTTYAVWASRQAGVTIRQEDAPRQLVEAFEKSAEIGRALEQARSRLGPLGALIPPVSGLLTAGDEGLDLISHEIATGNTKVFAEISREFSRFIEAFGGATHYDQARVDAYLAGFRPDQAAFRDGMAAYAKAMFEPDAEKKAELMLLGNARVGLHEQTFLQENIERSMNAPIEVVVRKNLEAALTRTLPGKLLAKAGLLDDALDPLIGAVSSVARRAITDKMMELALPGVTLRLGDDVRGDFPAALETIELAELREALARIDRTPDSLSGSAAEDWVRLGDRMNFIVDLFRAYQQDAAMFDEPFETPRALIA